MNKSRARIEFVEFYTGPAFIHLVCIKLYISILDDSSAQILF